MSHDVSTDLVGITVAQHEVGCFNVSMHILMVMDVLQNIQLNKKKYFRYNVSTYKIHLLCLLFWFAMSLKTKTPFLPSINIWCVSAYILSGSQSESNRISDKCEQYLCSLYICLRKKSAQLTKQLNITLEDSRGTTVRCKTRVMWQENATAVQWCQVITRWDRGGTANELCNINSAP